MKHTHWGLGLLSALGLFLSTSQNADAWLFHNCCHSCDMKICCKQYNAFTPVCFGNVHCIGCCPPTCGMPGGCGMPGPISSAIGPMMGCGDGVCGVGMPYNMPTHPGMQFPVSMPPQAPMMMPSGAPMPPGSPMPPPGNMPPILNHTAQYGYPMPSYGYGYGSGYGIQPASYYGYATPYYGANPYMGYSMPNYGYGYGYGYGAYGQQAR